MSVDTLVDTSLDAFVPLVVTVNVGHLSVAVTPITVGQLPRFVKALRPMRSIFEAKDGLAELEIDWLEVVADHGDSVIDAVLAATSLSRNFVEKLSPDEFITLAGAVIEVNVDFFARRLMGALTDTMTRVVSRLSGAMRSTP